LSANDLSSESSAPTLAGFELPLDMVFERRRLLSAPTKVRSLSSVFEVEVTSADNIAEAALSLVHTISYIFRPPGIPTSTLTEVINELGLDVVEAILQVAVVADFTVPTSHSWTLFAPSNQAFESFGTTLGLDSNTTLQDIVANTRLFDILKRILRAHIVETALEASELPQMVTTLGGEVVQVSQFSTNSTDNKAVNGIVPYCQ